MHFVHDLSVPHLPKKVATTRQTGDPQARNLIGKLIMVDSMAS